MDIFNNSQSVDLQEIKEKLQKQSKKNHKKCINVSEKMYNFAPF